MRSALGVDVRTGRAVRAWEDGRTEAVVAAEIAEAPEAFALGVGAGLDPAAWRKWVAARFGYPALEVAEDIARGYAEDIAAGAALWALAETKRRAVVVPPVIPGSPRSLEQDPALSMGDFGDGQTMSDFGDGQSMSDLAEPAQMSDFGEGNQMGDFGDGSRMGDVATSRPSPPSPPTAPPPPQPQPMVPPAKTSNKLKVQIAVAAAAVVVLAAGTAAALTLSGSSGNDLATVVPPTPAPPTEPPDTFSDGTDSASDEEFASGAQPFSKVFDIEFAVTATNDETGAYFVGMRTPGVLFVSCRDSLSTECHVSVQERESFDDPGLLRQVTDAERSGDVIEGETITDISGCIDRLINRLSITLDGEFVTGEGAQTASSLQCSDPEGESFYTFYEYTFEGVLRPEGVTPVEGGGLSIPPSPDPALPEAKG